MKPRRLFRTKTAVWGAASAGPGALGELNHPSAAQPVCRRLLCLAACARRSWCAGRATKSLQRQPPSQTTSSWMHCRWEGSQPAGLSCNLLVSTHGSRHLHVVWLVRQRWVTSLLTARPATGPPQAKLAGQAGVKYAAVASHAAAEGRRGLAALLLEHERVAAEQVPLLLDLGR